MAFSSSSSLFSSGFSSAAGAAASGRRYPTYRRGLHVVLRRDESASDPNRITFQLSRSCAFDPSVRADPS